MMKNTEFRFMAGMVAGVMLAGVSVAQTASRIPPTAAPRSADSGKLSKAGRGMLPDPVLLDGAAQPAEKKSEYGMIGDFEVPGDQDVRTGKVGGTPGGSGGGQQPPDPNAKPPSGMPAGGGTPGQQEAAAKSGAGSQGAMQAAQAGGGGGGQEGPAGGGGQEGQAGGQAGGGGAQAAQAGGQPGGGGAGEPIAQAQGMQVAGIGGDSAGIPQGNAGPQKPGAVSIGDKAMQIPQTNKGMAGVVGAQQPAGANTQVYEKPTGTGGKGPTGQQGPNRTEKGRPIPAGL